MFVSGVDTADFSFSGMPADRRTRMSHEADVLLWVFCVFELIMLSFVPQGSV